MLSRLSSFKRASRSLAKTGLDWVFFSVSFSVVFLVGVLYGLLRHFSRNGCHLGAFWQTFGHVLEVCGVLLGGTHSQAKTHNFHVLEVPGRHFFVHFSRSGFRVCSLSIFPWFSVIWEPFGAPFWLPLGFLFVWDLRGVQDRWQSRLRGAQSGTFRWF